MSSKRNRRPNPPVLRVRFNYNIARHLGVSAIEAAHVGELANGFTQDEIAVQYRTDRRVISTRIWRLRKRRTRRTTTVAERARRPRVFLPRSPEPADVKQVKGIVIVWERRGDGLWHSTQPDSDTAYPWRHLNFMPLTEVVSGG